MELGSEVILGRRGNIQLLIVLASVPPLRRIATRDAFCLLLLNVDT